MNARRERAAPQDDWAALSRTFGEAEILARYRAHFGLGAQVGPDEARRHLDLESELTARLYATRPDERVQEFAAAYKTLFEQLPWLVATGAHAGAEDWIALLRPGARVYEIGGGAGYLARALADAGFDCTMTDLSEDRRAGAQAGATNLKVAYTDGVNLSRYAEPGAFDYLISDQVVEHLHPDDLATHFAEARKLLRPGGAYIFRTPYLPLGPSGLIGAFGLKPPAFMHLHEMTYGDVRKYAAAGGFTRIAAVFTAPGSRASWPSELYFRYLLALELAFVTGRLPARVWRGLARPLKLRRDVFVRLRR